MRELSPIAIGALEEMVRYPGRPPELADYGVGPLAFRNRDRVIGALERRGLVEQNQWGDWVPTAAGRHFVAALTANPKKEE